MSETLKKVGMAIAIVLLLGTGFDQTESMPENADVFIVNKEYVGLPTMQDMMAINPKIRYTKMTAKEARAKGYPPNDQSVNNGDFHGEWHSLTYRLFQEIGVFPKQPRWEKDGRWNW